MKIPQVHSAGMNSVVNSTLKSGKKLIKDTKKRVKQISIQSRKTFAAAMFVSGGLNPQINKSVNFISGFEGNGDMFVRTSPRVITDCFTSKVPVENKLSIKPEVKSEVKPAAKVSAIKSAKDIVLTEGKSLSVKDMNVILNNLLFAKNKKINPLKNKAGLFIAKADKYGVNPIVLMAISLAESSRGTSSAAINKNNVGGIMGKKGLRKFENVEDCIDKMAETISKHHKNLNINTLEELGYSGKYCNKSAAEEWIKNVMFYVKKLK